MAMMDMVMASQMPKVTLFNEDADFQVHDVFSCSLALSMYRGVAIVIKIV